MGSFISELVSAFIDAVVPERAGNVIVGLILGCAFGGVGVFIAYQIATKRAEPMAGVGVLLFAGLSAACFRFTVKSLRAPSRSKS